MQWCELPPTFLLVLSLSGWFLMGGLSCWVLVWMSGMCMKFWNNNILFATFWLNSITYFLMYLRKALLDQRPFSMIMNTGYSPQYITMAAPDLMKCIPMSSFSMPSFTSPMAPTASLNAFIMCVDITCSRCPITVTVKMRESWDEPGYFLIFLTIAAAALTKHRQASCEAIRVTVSIFLSFFCCLNMRAMQSTNSSSLWSWSSCSTPQKKLTFLSLRILVLCCLGFPTSRYLQERMAKNIPTVASLPVVCSSLVLFWWMSLLTSEMGIAFWWSFSGSVFLSDLNSCCRMNAGCRSLPLDGFGCPFSQKVAHTYCTVSLNVPTASRSWDALLCPWKKPLWIWRICTKNMVP